MDEPEEFARELRQLADDIEAGRKQITGTEISTTLFGEGCEFTIEFTDWDIIDFNKAWGMDKRPGDGETAKIEDLDA